MSTEQDWRARWLERTHAWGARLGDSGLGGIAGAFALALRPVGPVLAQVLWVAQPGLGLLGQGEAVGALAELLADPAGLQALTARLHTPDQAESGE